MREAPGNRLGDAHGVVEGGVAPFSLGLDMAQDALHTCHQVRFRA